MSIGRWTAAVVLVATAACTSPKSKACREICARESECNGNRPTEASSFDEGECVAACAALENDKNPFIAGQVSKRSECLRSTASCGDYQSCAGK
jgi:hypothetical protein